ncbi:MAG TPA: Ig-like domain-containing protein [Chthonomonadaceae bacterium]|nr:Ig-like domain-containing protein [Chthonomonadaceae bacterium]
MVWPTRSRLIPVASNSIKIALSTNPVMTQLLARPAQGGSASVTFDKVPVGTYIAQMQAFPQADGTGTAQAAASSSVTIVAGQTQSVSVTMNSTIDHFEVAPNAPPILVAQPTALMATAKDAAGNVVLTSSNTIQWQSSNPNIARVGSDGTVFGVSGGTAQITVTDTESQKSASVTASVSWPPTVDVYAGATLSPGFNMGVNTSGGLTNWVTDQHGYMDCAYPAGQQWGAIFLTVGPPVSDLSSRETYDLSVYDFLSIDLKGGSGGETVSIGMKTATDPDNGLEPTYVAANLSSGWQTVKIPLSSLVNPPAYPATRFTNMYVVCELVFEPGTSAETVSFRNIRFEKSGKLLTTVQ